jgi:hypothetical protein
MYNPAMKLFVTAGPNAGKHSLDRVVRVTRVRKSRCDSRDGCEACASRQVGRRGPEHDRQAIQRADACGADSRERFRYMGGEDSQRGPDFLRLARALFALCPRDRKEKRVLDAVLLAVPR